MNSKKIVFIAFVLILTYGYAPKAHALVFPRERNAVGGQLFLIAGDKTFTVTADTVQSWRGLVGISKYPSLTENVYSPEDMLKHYVGQKTPIDNSIGYLDFKPQAIYSYINERVGDIETPVQEPKLTIQDNKVTEFIPPQSGIRINKYASIVNILNALETGNPTATIDMVMASPTQKLADTNTLGIAELIAEGTSNFKGSPNNRIHNIKVGVQKETGILVAPGEEFSFNKNLGEVDGQHGFLPELVIKGHDTIPEFGGGLCQVSSTTFRAAMNAGLPITQRRNHAYAVQYYSPQGTDATIYPGVIDLKFMNDTGNTILIWPYFKDKVTLAFDFYGTKDGRQVTVDKPVITERKPDGTMKASWQREVTKDGQTRTDVFKSVYQPAALFHHDTFTGSSTPATTETPKVN